MIKSMTGFGRAEMTLNGREISVEIHAVNHRYLELSFRLPRGFMFAEEGLRAYIGKQISRGKVDVGVRLGRGGEDVVVEPNLEAAKGYKNALLAISRELDVEADISANALAGFPEVLDVAGAPPNEEELSRDLISVTREALKGFFVMRENEGAEMKADILSRLNLVEDMAAFLESVSPERLKRHIERLTQRMKAVLDSAGIDENRILLEAAIFADKSAVDEETVRIKSHISQFRAMLETDAPVGRKLDFLTQELNREINTVGSKSADADTAAKVVEAKAELEKIREQIQNIE